MKNIGVRTIDIEEGVSDYYSIMTDIKRFVIKYGLENAYINKLQLLIEEFMVSFFKPNANPGDKMRVILKYDKKTGKVVCRFLHNIEKSIFDDGLENISAKLIKKLPSTITEAESVEAPFIHAVECII